MPPRSELVAVTVYIPRSSLVIIDEHATKAYRSRAKQLAMLLDLAIEHGLADREPSRPGLCATPATWAADPSEPELAAV